ncbi:MAG: GNAT family N-acetyltransferase [Acidimicrobiia bacterium]
MVLEWRHEGAPVWDAGKARIVGGAAAGIFRLPASAEGERLPGDWWRVEDGGAVVAYGWMDTAWGDAEMLLAVDPGHHNRGVGTFVLDRLEHEAANRGINYLYNVVRATHPDHDRVTAWLESRSFEGSSDGILRRRARSATTRGSRQPSTPL